MQTFKHFLVFIFLIGLTFSCQKDVEENYQPLVFNGLTSTSSNFQTGSSVTLSADVSGTNVTYHWSYNSGVLTGGGDNVNYTNDAPGYYTIICTAEDGAGELVSREISLNVY